MCNTCTQLSAIINMLYGFKVNLMASIIIDNTNLTNGFIVRVFFGLCCIPHRIRRQ